MSNVKTKSIFNQVTMYSFIYFQFQVLAIIEIECYDS